MRVRPELVRASIQSLIPAVVTCVLWAGTSAAYDRDASIHGRYRGECRKLTKQIDYYNKQILPLAIERRNPAWEGATNDQVKRLWNKRADMCPEYGRDRTRLRIALDKIRAFNEVVARAGRAAASYFSGGLLP